MASHDIQYPLIAVAVFSALCSGACDREDTNEDDTSVASALSSSSFAFQHPLTGSSYTRSCNFDTTNCAVAGQYHTGTDDSTLGNPPVRAANFGQRTLVQVNGQNDHGFGNAIAIKFLLSNGSWIYSTDNHMASIYPLAARPDGSVQAPRGAKVGEVGKSGYGNPNYWPGNPHLHQEFKTAGILSNPCGVGPYWGYTPTSATNFCYQNPDSFMGSRQVLMPEFSTTDGGWGDYDVVYGVANTAVYARVALQGAQQAYSHLGVGGRAGWSATVTDFPMSGATPVGNVAHVANRTFTAGDYRFFGAVQTTGGEWRTGFPVIFTVVSKSTDFIRDNDMYSPYFNSGGLGAARYDGYGYGAHAAVGNSGAWAQWQAKTGTFSLYVYVGGNGAGSVKFKIYPSGAGNPIYTDTVNMGAANYGWVQLKAGATTSWTFTSAGYVGLSADAGSASDVVLFDAIKFVSP